MKFKIELLLHSSSSELEVRLIGKNVLLLHKIVKKMIRYICEVQTYVKTVSVLGTLEPFCRGSVWVTFTTDSNPKRRSYR